MIDHVFILFVSLFFLIRGATMATTYATRLADGYRLSTYVVGFIVVAIISILPETFVAVTSATNGIPEFGLGVLFGSNVADLTLVFALTLFAARRDIKIESKILKQNAMYPFLLFIPLLLGADGYYSRIEGLTLLIIGMVFYIHALRGSISREKHTDTPVGSQRKNILFLLLGMSILLLGAHFTVSSASELALMLGVSPILIGMLVVGLGTTMPELLFSVKAVRKHKDALAIGDVLGTVLADATMVVGILALVAPFQFPKAIVYVTGVFMVVAAFLLFHFMRTGRLLTKKEAVLLVLFWLLFVATEYSLAAFI